MKIVLLLLIIFPLYSYAGTLDDKLKTSLTQSLAISETYSCLDQPGDKFSGLAYSSLIAFNENGEVLAEENSDELIYPASVFKLMTLYLTFEQLKKKQLSLDTALIASPRTSEVSKVNKITTLKLNPGDTLTVKQAIAGIIVKSFNEAAVILGEALAENEWDYARLANKKAAALGMTRTHFKNATGLYDPGQYTTAHDLALLTIAIRRDFKQYYNLFSLANFSYQEKLFRSHNFFLLNSPYAEGLKTGYIKASGYNLVSAVSNNKNRVMMVMIGFRSSKVRDCKTEELANKFLNH